MKAIKVKRCSDNLFWYKEYVGCIVPFLRENNDAYLSREPAGYSNIVKKTDGEVIEVAKGTEFYVHKTN